MSRLKSRDKFIPNGFRFYQPETGWKSQPNASFETIVQGLVAHRKGNAFLVAKHRWPTDLETVRDEVDQFNALICERMGWSDYIQAPGGGAPPTFFPSPSPHASPTDPGGLAAVAEKVKTIWAGVRTLNDWLDSNTGPVPSEQSAARAAVCAVCPKNVAGDFTSWFTRPAAEVIRKQLERVTTRNLSTPDDARINVCGVCYCPMKLKVHTPLAYINPHLSEAVIQELSTVSPVCWIMAERRQ